jgi:hypothetical protein
VNGGAGGVVPVRLARFDAEPTDQGIRLTWEFSGAGEYSTVRLERRASFGEAWQVMASRAVDAGTVTFFDRDAAAGREYEYRLVADRTAGGTHTFESIVARMPASGRTEVSSVGPNPTKGRTAIEFVLAREAEVDIAVVDVQGRRIVQVVSGRVLAGRHVAEWDGRIAGEQAPAGIYFERSTLDENTWTKRLTVVR